MNLTAANHSSNQKTRNPTLILKDLLKPAVKEITVGVGDKAKKIGGKLVMYRHEFTYKNPTAIAIDVTDEMSDSEIVSRVQKQITLASNTSVTP